MIAPEQTWKEQPVRVAETDVDQSKPVRASSPQPDLRTCLTAILGYDVLHADLLAEGYQEMAEHDALMAESNAGASFETIHTDEV